MAWFQKENKQYFFYEHDMHSHILPGLDDGVKTIEESVAIVKRMLALGVRRFSFTPHISFPQKITIGHGKNPVADGFKKKEVNYETP